MCNILKRNAFLFGCLIILFDFVSLSIENEVGNKMSVIFYVLSGDETQADRSSHPQTVGGQINHSFSNKVDIRFDKESSYLVRDDLVISVGVLNP